VTEVCRGDLARAEALLEESVRLCRDLGHREQLLWALGIAGWLAWHQGDLSRATAFLEEGMAVAEAIGKQDLAATNLTWLVGHVAHERGEHQRAVRLYREALATQHDRNLHYRLLSLEGLAITLGALGQVAEAAWLLGSAEAAREVLGLPLRPPDRAAYDRSIAAMRRELGDDTWTAAWAAGRATPLEAAIAHALEATSAGIARH
jgi:hypothetical protein